MPSKLAKHFLPPSAPLFLSVTQPEAVPWTYVLESWRDALQKPRLKHMDRSQRGAENLRASEEEIERIKERGRKEKLSQRRSAGPRLYVHLSQYYI